MYIVDILMAFSWHNFVLGLHGKVLVMEGLRRNFCEKLLEASLMS